MNENSQANIEAIVISIDGERLVLPIDTAKKLKDELNRLFGSPVKEYVPWPWSFPQVEINPAPRWWGTTSDGTGVLYKPSTAANSYIVDTSKVTASYTISTGES